MVVACRCGIDVHAHIVPENFPAYLAQPDLPGWPSMAPAQACHRTVMIDGRAYRTVNERCWNAALRVADMAEMGLALQAVSPMPELFSYWLPAAAADELLRYINDQIAEMVAASDGRIVGLGAVPLQDMDRAVAELHRLRGMGFAGVEIGSNVLGRPIGAAEFAPFFAECAALDAAVFVHAVRPAGMDRLVGPAPLQQALGYPSEIGLAAASVITGAVMARHPSLRIGFSHGGGTLGLLLPRLEQSCAVFPAVRETVGGSPTEQARRLFYDALVFDAPTLRHLVALFGETQVMIGTDYPFNFHDATPVERIEAAFADGAVRERLMVGNARRFLGGGGVTAFPVSALRSVDLEVPDLAGAERFYTEVWGLAVAGRSDGAVWLRATGADHHVVVLHAGPEASLRSITFRVDAAAALAGVAARCVAAGGRVVQPIGAVDWPGGGTGLTIVDPQGRVLRFVFGDARQEALPAARDRPERLSHVNVNSRDTEATRAFFETVCGFRLSDRSKLMAFVRCNDDHHVIVIADAEVDGLNHVAFLVGDLEGVLLAAGRLVDHGFPIAWGVGRHGPGDNVFAYFIDPFGIVVEFTAELSKVDESSRIGGPADWTWPPGRTDQWGIAAPKSAALHHAQLAIRFKAVG